MSGANIREVNEFIENSFQNALTIIKYYENFGALDDTQQKLLDAAYKFATQYFEK